MSFRPNEGPEVPAGTYTITVKYKDDDASQQINVLPDPRYDIPMSVRQAKYDAILHAGHVEEVAARAIKRIAQTRKDIETIVAKAKVADEQKKQAAKAEGKESSKPDPIIHSAQTLEKRLGEVEKMFWAPPDTKGIIAEEYAMAKIGMIQGSLASSWDAPTPAQMGYMKEAESSLQKALDALNKFESEDVAKFRDEVAKSDLTLLPTRAPLTLEK